ncbi:ATPase [Candidatus Peregrinibacteria bacterium RIFOXYB2_FULL_32_7]|nr:MAG: ATPase [Candidatus Peregrinibacteria bacterium RIFOXYB2_FULL_32_7]
MAQLGIREYNAKKMLAKYLPEFSNQKVNGDQRVILLYEGVDFGLIESENPWLKETKLVMKPDQLFGKRGKHGLVWLNLTWDEVKNLFKEKINSEATVGKIKGKLTHFIVEAFTPHELEYYVSITTERDGDVINFSINGGIEIEAVWNSVKTVKIPILQSREELNLDQLVDEIPQAEEVKNFIKALYKVFVELNFTFLEINPFTFVDGKVLPLDCVAKLDNTGLFESGRYWGDVDFPKSFGLQSSKEEEYIESLDAKTGASLKLTILNPDGAIWPMVAGGGASVIYADTVADLGFGKELACYGEYSGGPSTEETKAYAETILDLMTRRPHPENKQKVLLIGGGIANFTDVAKTFKGIVLAFEEYAEKLKKQHVKIYVRRGGPNYKEGLKQIKSSADRLGLDMEVYGPETHMTKIVAMALQSN